MPDAEVQRVGGSTIHVSVEGGVAEGEDATIGDHFPASRRGHRLVLNEGGRRWADSTAVGPRGDARSSSGTARRVQARFGRRQRQQARGAVHVPPETVGCVRAESCPTLSARTDPDVIRIASSLPPRL